MRRDRWSLEEQERAQRAVADLARRMLDGELGVIAGAREMWRMATGVVDDVWEDDDFAVFAALDTETDHLPIETQRALWDEAAFAEREITVARIEDANRESVFAACRSLLERFGGR